MKAYKDFTEILYTSDKTRILQRVRRGWVGGSVNKIVEVEETPRGLHVYRAGYKITGEQELEDDDQVILEMNDGVCFGVWILDYLNWSVSDWLNCSARDVVILDTKVDAEVERWIRDHP